MFIIQVFLGCDTVLGQLDPEDRGTLLLRNNNINLTVENTSIFIDTVLATSISSMFIHVCKCNFFLCCISWELAENLTFLPFPRQTISKLSGWTNDKKTVSNTEGVQLSGTALNVGHKTQTYGAGL